MRRHMRLDPAFLPRTVDNRTLDRFDRDGIVVDVQRAGSLAWGWADAASELWEVVGGMQHPDRVLPLMPIDQIVPVRDQVVDRTALVAERDAAIHATRCLLGQLVLRQLLQELRPRLAPDVRLIVAAI